MKMKKIILMVVFPVSFSLILVAGNVKNMAALFEQPGDGDVKPGSSKSKSYKQASHVHEKLNTKKSQLSHAHETHAIEHHTSSNKSHQPNDKQHKELGTKRLKQLEERLNHLKADITPGSNSDLLYWVHDLDEEHYKAYAAKAKEHIARIKEELKKFKGEIAKAALSDSYPYSVEQLHELLKKDEKEAKEERRLAQAAIDAAKN